MEQTKIFCHVLRKDPHVEKQPTDLNELIGEAKECRVVTLPSHLYDPLAETLDLLKEAVGDVLEVKVSTSPDHGGSLVVESDQFNITITKERVLV